MFVLETQHARASAPADARLKGEGGPKLAARYLSPHTITVVMLLLWTKLVPGRWFRCGSGRVFGATVL